ncbi:thiamine pyrophosphate-binding protein [Actibacterium mucosum KCTC 23349]|uniref:Thiamine pyrophosphate-binding protein n=1 Tax=Actibacterium mucosum KCTC 23349 TaxID=1454373 RepID=A0A037ZKH0_9RHOB|nr:acetolactate synthase large subunit [Actibacterium mucosum]KAJ56052.1 thiamine pyrophosphate-binding protein [Actibacterium mucosum KCTC 23349]
MNGAESLVKTLLASGVDTCFANPGTSEMHFVAALDDHPDMNCILCLFEGGVSGAADGYFRMKGDVSATLLHLAPGFGNAFGNTHNARKAGSGMVHVVGNHAGRHMKYESPLRGDVPGVAGAVSHWVRESADATDVAADGAAAIRAARSKNGQIATLILPADTAWEAGSAPLVAEPAPAPDRPSAAQVEAAAAALTQPGAILYIGRGAMFGPARRLAGQIAAHTGARLMADTFFARAERGAGTPVMGQLPYPVPPKMEMLKDATQIICVGNNRPVAFFAYPDRPSLPEPPTARVHELCDPQMDAPWTIQALAQALDIPADAPFNAQPLALPDAPTGAVTLEKVGASLAHYLPENAIVMNESITSSFVVMPPTVGARPHDLLTGTGGSIGICLPCATGAAVAAPDRKVLALTGDGSAMYTLQSLWTMAREQLDVTVVVFANRGYQILHGELNDVGAGQPGRNAARMFDIVEPQLDWVSLARGHGVPATRADTMEAFNKALADGFASDGPSLIELVCP